jgi:hypothetical protein
MESLDSCEKPSGSELSRGCEPYNGGEINNGRELHSPNLLMLVRSLKGAPLACLVVLRLSGRPLTSAFLGSLTGYSPHTVAQALQALLSMGLASADARHSNWQLSPAAEELDLWPSRNGEAAEGDSGVNRDFCHPDPAATAESLDFQRSSAVAAGKPIEKGAKRGRRGVRRTIQPGPSPYNPPDPGAPPGKPQPENLPPLDPAVLQALHQAGIGEPTASRLAAMAHIDLAYVQAHAARARREGIRVALLIHRMRAGDPAPEMLEKSSERYITGKYAEFVNH